MSVQHSHGWYQHANTRWPWIVGVMILGIASVYLWHGRPPQHTPDRLAVETQRFVCQHLDALHLSHTTKWSATAATISFVMDRPESSCQFKICGDCAVATLTIHATTGVPESRRADAALLAKHVNAPPYVGEMIIAPADGCPEVKLLGRIDPTGDPSQVEAFLNMAARHMLIYQEFLEDVVKGKSAAEIIRQVEGSEPK